MELDDSAEPVVDSEDQLKKTNSFRGETQYDHPSFGMFAISHITGNSLVLHGSSIKHSSVMCIRISKASLIRNLSYDRSHADGEIVEVWMTPVQWAEALTNTNTQGVACTIKHVCGKTLQEPPFISKREQFAKEIRDVTNSARTHAHEGAHLANEMLAKSSITKSDVKKLLECFNKIGGNMGSSVEYVEEQFTKQAAMVVAEAKAEVDAFVTHTIVRMGMQALAKQDMGPLALGYLEGDNEL